MKIIFSWVLCCSVILSCRLDSTMSNSEFTIVCTTGMIGDAVQEILGPEIKVHRLMGPGVDPHLYKPSPDVVNLLKEADLIVHNGLHLEGKMGEIFNTLAQEKIVLQISDGLPSERLLLATGENTGIDPHIWFDVSLWREGVAYLGAELAKISTFNPEEVGQNTAVYLQALDELHRWVSEKISQIPRSKRVLITSHDAFQYFGRAYDIEVRGLQGISTVAEFGLKDITDLVQFIVTRRIPAVFVESSVSDKSMQAVREGCKTKGLDLKIGGTLYSDAMGPEDQPEGKYIGMVHHNVNTIYNALTEKDGKE